MINWERRKVNELFDIVTGTTPSTKELKYWNDGDNLWITPTDLSKLKNNIYIFNTERKITSIALKEVNLSELPINSIILSTRAPVGYVAIIKKEATFNQGCKAIVAKENNICSEFYYYYFLSIRNYLESISSGSTFKELSKDTFSNIEIVFPPLIEQKAIAEILLTVDNAIQKSNEGITRTKRIKRETMNKLLTQGIGHKNFKETKIGKIPSEWDVKKLNEIGFFQYGYTTISLQEDTGIKFVRITDIKEDGTINWDTVPYCKIPSNEIIKYKLYKNDILFARIGATSGKTTFIEKLDKSIFASYLIRYKVNENSYPKFVFHFTQSSYYWNQALKNREAQLKKGLNANTLSSFDIQIPSLKEQKMISEILTDIDRKIKFERERKQKFINIKKSLMNDLFSGKKRVNL